MHYKRSVFRSLAMVTQLGLSVVTPIFLCVFAGYQMDARWGTKSIVPLLLLGVLAGGRNAWLLAKRTLLAEQQEDEADRLQRRQSQPRSGAVKPKEPSRIRGKSALPGAAEEREKEPPARQATERESDDNGTA